MRSWGFIVDLEYSEEYSCRSKLSYTFKSSVFPAHHFSNNKLAIPLKNNFK
jgi:hypothetical protein